jgi:hypothetical protein
MWNDMENMEENREKIWKIRKKNKLNSEKVWKIWYGQYGTKASWIVKRYETNGRKLWNDMENRDEK